MKITRKWQPEWAVEATPADGFPNELWFYVRTQGASVSFFIGADEAVTLAHEILAAAEACKAVPEAA